MGRNVFDGLRVNLNPATDVVNNAGGVAYSMGPEQAFAQLMLTGTFNNTCHVTGQAQLESFLDLAGRVGPDFRHKAAYYAADNGGSRLAQYSAIAVSMANGDVEDGFEAAFKRVVRGIPAVRELVGIFRSGVLGRKSFGTRPKRLLKRVLENMPAEALFRGSLGDKPSFGDVIKLLHPKPTDDAQRALYAREISRPHNPEHLPEIVQQYDTFRKTGQGEVPQVDIRLLQGLNLTDEQWAALIPKFSWHTLRMNVRRWHEKGLFQKFPGLADKVAARLSRREEIVAVRPEAYQLMMAYLATKGTYGFPSVISEAFQDAMELALEFVPVINGRTAIAVDVSGSMRYALTGDRAGGTSNVRKVDVASLFAAAVLRKNADAIVLPFHGMVLDCHLNPRDSVMTNAEKLAKLCDNGTNCAAPVRELVNRRDKVDTIIMFSDNESWMNPEGRTTGPSVASYHHGAYSATGLMDAYTEYRNKVNSQARLVCVDLEPNMSTQVINRKDILNVGGFSDSVFKIVGLFATGEFDGDLLVKKIKSMTIQ